MVLATVKGNGLTYPLSVQSAGRLFEPIQVVNRSDLINDIEDSDPNGQNQIELYYRTDNRQIKLRAELGHHSETRK
jgi:hypothetical protein